MRWLSFVSAVWLASLVCGNLLATGGGVSIPPRLQGTAAGQRVVDIYKGLVGQAIRFYLDSNTYFGRGYTGKIEEVIVPDIRTYIDSGDSVHLKFKVSSVQAEAQAAKRKIPEIISTKHIDPRSIRSIPSDIDYDYAGISEVKRQTLRKNIQWVRGLALDRDVPKGEEILVEVLVEIESDGDAHTEIEPFIEKLPLSGFTEVPLQAIGSDFMGRL